MYYFVARLVFLLLVCVIIGVKGRHHRHHHRRHNASQEQAQRRDNLGFLRSFTAENLHFSKLFSDKLTNGSPRTKVSHRMPAWQKHHTKAFRSNDDDDTSFDDDELAEIKRNSKEEHFITSESRIHHTKDFETEEPSEATQPYIDALSDHKDTALMEARGKSSKAEEGSAASSGDDEGSSSAAYQVNKEPPIPHKTHQGVMDTSRSSPASSQSPMEDLPANIPVPPMIPLPLFYNSGEEETSTSATVDVKPTSELEDGVGESGNGEYTPPTRQKQMEADDWVDRLLKEDQKSKGFDEDDAFDGEEDEEEEEEAKAANKPQQQQQSTSQVATQQVAAKVANNNAQKPASNNNNAKQQSNTGDSSALWNSQQMPQQNNNINNNNNNGFQQVPDFYQKPVIQQYPQQQNNMAQSNNNNFNMQNNNVVPQMVPTGNSNSFGNNNNFNSNNMMNNNGFIPNSNTMNGNNNNFLNNNNLLNKNNMNNNNLMANNNMMKNNWNNNFNNNNNNLNNNNMNYFNNINNNNMMNKNTELDNTLAAKNVAPTLTQNFAAPTQTNNTSFVEQESVCMIGCPSTCSPSCDPECCSKKTEVAETKEESGVHYPSPLILPEVQRSQPIGATSVVPSEKKPSNIQAPFIASSTQSMVQSFVAPSTNQAFNSNYNAGKVEGQENSNPAPVEFNSSQKPQISLQPVRPFQLKLPFFQNVVHMRKPVQETQDTTEVKYPNPGPVCAKGCITNCLPHCTNYCCGVASKRQAIQRSRISRQ